MRSIQQNFQTAVLAYGPNETRSIQKMKVQVFPVWNKQLVNNSFTVQPPPCIMCVQYIGGCSVHQGDTMSTSGEYHEYRYIGGCSVHREGYHEYIGGIP